MEETNKIYKEAGKKKSLKSFYDEVKYELYALSKSDENKYVYLKFTFAKPYNAHSRKSNKNVMVAAGEQIYALVKPDTFDRLHSSNSSTCFFNSDGDELAFFKQSVFIINAEVISKDEFTKIQKNEGGTKELIVSEGKSAKGELEERADSPFITLTSSDYMFSRICNLVSVLDDVASYGLVPNSSTVSPDISSNIHFRKDDDGNDGAIVNINFSNNNAAAVISCAVGTEFDFVTDTRSIKMSNDTYKQISQGNYIERLIKKYKKLIYDHFIHGKKSILGIQEGPRSYELNKFILNDIPYDMVLLDMYDDPARDICRIADFLTRNARLNNEMSNKVSDEKMYRVIMLTSEYSSYLNGNTKRADQEAIEIYFKTGEESSVCISSVGGFDEPIIDIRLIDLMYETVSLYVDREFYDMVVSKEITSTNIIKRHVELDNNQPEKIKVSSAYGEFLGQPSIELKSKIDKLNNSANEKMEFSKKVIAANNNAILAEKITSDEISSNIDIIAELAISNPETVKHLINHIGVESIKKIELYSVKAGIAFTKEISSLKDKNEKSITTGFVGLGGEADEQ